MKVGIFTLLGLLVIGGLTVFVNDRPFWWRPCELVFINIDDATGLKTKSPIRSLGLQIGFLKSVDLYETYVRLGICITAPVDVLPSTRAFIRAEGFLGDKFVELKPVKFTGPRNAEEDEDEDGLEPDPAEKGLPAKKPGKKSSFFKRVIDGFSSVLIPVAYAVDIPAANIAGEGTRHSREIPVGPASKDMQQVVNQVDNLVREVTELTNNIKQGIDPKELRNTMTQLNKALENASKALAPEGGLNTTAQRTLAKLEDAIEQLRDQLTRINRGEGSVGMILNDPKYANELHEALKNINKLLVRVGGIRLAINLGAEQHLGYEGGRGFFKLGIWPAEDRYYLIGISIDPRGSRRVVTTTTSSGGVTTQTQTTTMETTALLFNAMLGKVLWHRLDLSAGILHSDGTVSVGIQAGPHEIEDALVLRNDIYTRGSASGIDDRISLMGRPLPKTNLLNTLYIQAGLESLKKVNGKLDWFFGGGITFDDEDIKLLFAFK